MLALLPLWAQDGVAVKRVGPPGRVSSAIWAGDTLYVSGTMATPDVIGDGTSKKPPACSGDTKAQTVSAIRNSRRSRGWGVWCRCRSF